MINGMSAAHGDSWYVTILLFVITIILLKVGVTKAAKILHMILRLFYVIMIFSGVVLLATLWNFALLYVIKGILAIVLIYSMEMILVKTKKGTMGSKAPIYWGLFVVSLVLVALLGLQVITF